MDHRPTITAQDMRSINRSAIIDLIRRESPISRNAIAQRLEVSLPTVMRIVDDLIREELVRPQSARQWTGGRRRALLEFNTRGQAVVGVDLGGAEMFGAVADLGGSILQEAKIDRRGATGEESYRLLVELIRLLLSSPALKGRGIRGIGVGAPGVTRHEEGIVAWAYSLNWRNYPLRAKLAESFHLPIIVDNDVNLAALGELWFGAGQHTQDMVLVAIGTGVGAGVIIDGALYRGAHEASGEVGHMIPGREFLGKQYVDIGALESMVSATALAARGREALQNRRSPGGREDLSAEEVFDAARGGRRWARKLLDETVAYLAVAIANLCVSLDPELIVLGGDMTRAADLLVEPVLHRLEGMIPNCPRLVVSPLGRRAVVMGAIVNVLHNTDNFYLVRKLS